MSTNPSRAAADGQAKETKETKAKNGSRSLKEGRSPVLVEAELSRWNLITLEVRQQELGFLNERFHELLNEIYSSANLCVDRHNTLSKNHVTWRRTVIVGTGIVAIVNLLAANHYLREYIGPGISVLAAVIAVVLAILANLESFYNASEKAQAYRESREFFLDAAREFDRRWDAFVRPFTDNAEACVNASELYRQLVVKDSELRAKFKELTRTERAKKG
jgi:hypothetical protein